MIFTCVVTHNRLAYTQRCLDSLLATRRRGDAIVVVDNASTDGTVEYLEGLGRRIRLILNDTNRYPGAATNQGWDSAPPRYALLHRSDNDIEYRPGWQAEVEAAFAEYPEIALLGILNLHEDAPDKVGEGRIKIVPRVGGNVVMPTRLFREGMRWTEGAWQPGHDEDGPMSWEAARRGWVARLVASVADNMAFNRFWDFPDYYRETARVRGFADAEHSV